MRWDSGSEGRAQSVADEYSMSVLGIQADVEIDLEEFERRLRAPAQALVDPERSPTPPQPGSTDRQSLGAAMLKQAIDEAEGTAFVDADAPQASEPGDFDLRPPALIARAQALVARARPLLQEHRPLILLQEHRPSLQEHRPSLQEHRPSLQKHRPLLQAPLKEAP